LIEIFQQAVELQPSENIVTYTALHCSSGSPETPCPFVVYGAGLRTTVLACALHGKRLLCVDRHYGNSHEQTRNAEIRGEIADAVEKSKLT
jgi:hypothetical protein